MAHWLPVQTAFALFCLDMRSRVMRQNPGMKRIEVSRELGRRWKKAGAAVKAKYERMEDAERKKRRTNKEKD